MKLKDQVAVITGSRQGLGFAIASIFLEEGAKVVINGRNANKVKLAVNDLQKKGYTKVIGIAADIRDYKQAFKLMKKVISIWGRIDILVNNATDSAISPSEDLDPKDWNDTLSVNLTGSFYCSQAVAKLSMIPNKRGNIINVISMLGLRGLPDRAAYCAAKHGLIGLTQALAVEWGELNIRVNAICPSYIMTPMEKYDLKSGRYGYTLEDITKRMPLRRVSTPEEIAKSFVWLASDDSSFTTGSVIKTDGGWTAYGGW